MRVSELVDRSGVSRATIKYYLREGLLMPGEPTSATQSSYGDEHVCRLAIIKALAGAGLSIDRIRTIVEVLDHPSPDRLSTFGRALAALPPYVEQQGDDVEFPRARKVLDALGQVYTPEYPAVAQLERALAAAEDAGVPLSVSDAREYGLAMRDVASKEMAAVAARDPDDALQFSILGTVLYEPVLTALRRLAHQHIATEQFGADDRTSP